MPLTPGSKLGPYEILSPLGAGGMGEVYRARDTRLGREVAIKVLPQHLTANPEVRARFEREAKTVSSLNHPNICTLFDVGREGDTDYLVMELIEGETLGTRLERGALPTQDVLRIGSQIADALDRAHRAGVVHRDLKPGNVMLTRGGAKLMDFGLARATGVGGAAGSGVSMAALTQSPTVAQPLTAQGTIVGTFQYMSPEQLEGQETDARGDIWSFGCVLYEMATGKRAFEGKSQASLIGSIMNAEPAPISQFAPTTPPPLERLVRGCLTKNPDERIQTAHDVKLQLQWIAEGGSQTGMPAPVVGGGRRSRGALLVAWGVATIAILAGAAGIGWLWPRAHAPAPSYRFRTEAIPSVTDYSWPRISPDGLLMVVQVQDSTGKRQAWLRPMDQTVARPILGSEGLSRAYWSPDSREIAFVAGAKIQRLAIAGGTPTVVCEAHGGSDLSWGAGGFILMDGRYTDSLMVVSARGGELRPATRIYREEGEIGSAWPCFLPDGKRFLFIGNRTIAAGNSGDIRIGRLGSLESKLLGKSDGRVEYAPGDWVLYLKGTTLLAQKLDTGKEVLVGEPLTIAEKVRTGTSSGHFSISKTGVFAYSRSDEMALLTLLQTDRAGRPVGPALTRGLLANPAIPADGGRVLFQKTDNLSAGTAIVVRDLARGTETKLTLDGNAIMPVWSPDARQFACILSEGENNSSLLVASADGLGARTKIKLPAGGAWMLTQWSPSLRRLIATPPSFKGAYTANPDSADVAPRVIPALNVPLGHCTISPDGRWAAYVNNDDGNAPQVFVQSLTGTPGRWQISTKYGVWPVWTKSGTEIVFEGQPDLMAVSIDTRDGFHAGTPHALFPCPLRGDALVHYWTCTGDGAHFFVLQAPRSEAGSIIEVVTDFAALVNRR